VQDYCIAMLRFIKSQKLGDLFTIPILKVMAVFGFALISSACLPSPTAELPPILPTITQSSTDLPTQPVDWFPATSTPTSFPHATPTAAPIAQSNLGALISDQELNEAKNWSGIDLGSDSPNKVIWDENALYFAVNKPPISLYSLNQNLFVSEFYAEVIFSVNRCSPNDTYGLSFLAANEKFANRLVLRCDGYVRVTQVRDQLTIPLQDWELSGMAPPGAPGLVKAAVWSYKGEMRFFLNDQIQFSVSDRYYQSGGIGFFVEAKDPAGMNIKIQDLKVYELMTPLPTIQATP